MIVCMQPIDKLKLVSDFMFSYLKKSRNEKQQFICKYNIFSDNM